MLKCVVMSFPNPVESKAVETAFKEAGRLLPPDGSGREMKAHFTNRQGLIVGETVFCIVARRSLGREEQEAVIDALSAFALQTLIDGHAISKEMPGMPA